MNHTTGPRNLALPALLLHASAARVESKNLEIRLVEIWGRVCGKMIVEEQYESSRHSANLKTPPPCFKYILLYIPGRGLLHDMGTLHLLHPRCCDRSLRGKGVGMAASSCGTPQLKCQVLTSVFSISSWSNAWGQSRSKTNMKMDEHVPTMAGLFDMLNPGRK